MKPKMIVSFVVFTTLLFFPPFLLSPAQAQPPQKMSYQAIVRNAGNALVANHVVGMKFSILQGSETGTAIYSETQTPTTNANGLVSIEIGGGAGFDAIDWESGPYFIKTETDPTGGASYTITSTSQLLSVPYALHAKTASSYPETDPVFGASAANGITPMNIADWNTAYGWGNHAGLYRPVGYVPLWSEIAEKPTFATVATSGSYNDLSNKPTIINSQWIGSDRRIYYNTGNVGIGTDTPESALDVKGIVRASSSATRYLSFDAGREDFNAYINFAGADKPSRIIFQTNGINKMVIAANGRVGIGTDTPIQLLQVNGNAVVNGNLVVEGVLSGKLSVDSIHVTKIVGLLGQGYTMIFPDILNNYGNLEMNGIVLNEKVVITSTIGFETERISIPMGLDNNGNQRYREEAGLSMEFPIVFETATTGDIANLKTWFDGDRHPISLSIVIRNLAGEETNRWNCFEYVPDKYEPGTDGRTRFTIKHNLLPNNICHIEMAGADFGDQHSYNAATDKVVEIDGVISNGFSPAVVVNETNRTVTLTMDYYEGKGIYDWAKNTVRGLSYPKNMSIIETTDGVTETSRKNYFECISIKWELIYGFGLNNKLKARVVIAYGWWENA